MRPIHPGEVLRKEFAELLQTCVSMAANHNADRLEQLARCERSVTPAMASYLAHCLGTTAEFWLNLQAAYDARKAGSFDANGSPV